ncbi:MAG: type II toxin-antitoxin system HicB family antitoxin [Deltaproteobacteria bacterium]|nr:type II toxin-antitoxin system HicB family antitoxin [Deltaproteobacteria bacterium]
MKRSATRYQIFLRPEPEGGFSVFVPSLPGCITWGKDLDHAKRMAADAISAYLESLRKHSEPIPADPDGLVTSVEVRAAGA